MRIRKRQLQLPFSWNISPLPSDPNFNRSPLVQHPPRRHSPPSDHPNHPIQSTQRLDFPETTTHEQEPVLKQGEDQESGENGDKSNYTTTTRKKSVYGDQELGTGSQSLDQGDVEGGKTKTNPLKKRKLQKNKRGGGGALMEGSRCSRVNGRGWRCCQQTLAGYSLCEHHLGKGRLRSNHNNNNNNDDDAMKKEKKTPLIKQLASENEDEKPLMKLGIVKARSISSLLGQNDNLQTAVSDDN